MAQKKENEPNSFQQIMRLVGKLTRDERAVLLRRLELQEADERWNDVLTELRQKHDEQNLPPPTDDDIHNAIDASRTPEEWAAIRRDIQKGIDELNRGEGIPAEKVFEELRARNRALRQSE
jgi:hypothetical protein